jgi:PUA domain protein
MFRKFDPSQDVSTSTQVKASVQRALRAQIRDAHPQLTDDILEELFPKKHPLVQYKVGPHLMLYCRHVEHHNKDEDDDDDRSPTDEPMFFQQRDGPILPTLKMVHQYPTLTWKQVTVDRGAIPFVIGGAHIMCPGLTNPGGEMPPDGEVEDDDGFDKPGLAKGDGVVIYAQGKEYAIAVGVMMMSSAEM